MARTPSSSARTAGDELTSARPQRSLRWRYLVLAVTASILVLNYADRSALSVAGPTLMKDVHLSDAEFGFLSSVFYLGYVPFCFVGGSLSDRRGPRSIMGLAVAWWSVFTTGSPSVKWAGPWASRRARLRSAAPSAHLSWRR